MQYSQKGYSFIELLITIFIAGLIMAAAYYTYVEIFRGMKEESESVEAQMEKVIGLELIRLDLEHVGYGISPTSTYKIIDWNETNKVLTLRSTLNNTDQSTFGWVLCKDGDLIGDSREDTTNGNIVYIDINSNDYVAVVDDGTCPPTNVLVGFPIDNNANDCPVDGTNTCITIQYSLSDTNELKHCNPNTRNLLRKVGDAAGIPILNCVLDFTVRFGLDTDGDGQIDTYSTTVPTNNTDIVSQLKVINFYAVIQEGGLNKNYVYKGPNPIVIDSVVFNLPSDHTHYRWKVLKISVKPLGMFGGIVLH